MTIREVLERYKDYEITFWVGEYGFEIEPLDIQDPFFDCECTFTVIGKSVQVELWNLK